uniref:Chromate transport protein n=1 Tax=Mycobacterium riyadhense TaxID=486698 RepID=A0A653EDI3_9MYCO|nr:Chromate transport protein [Mycobacterium riyadhense]
MRCPAGSSPPGPVFTTATLIGYLIAGPLGALLATVAIFLPSFLFIGLLTEFTDKLRSAAWSPALLDGVNSAALALMAGIRWQLGRTAIVDSLTVGTLALLWRGRLNNVWCIAADAGVGLLHALFT